MGSKLISREWYWWMFTVDKKDCIFIRRKGRQFNLPFLVLFFLLTICCLATSVVWSNIWASVCFDSTQQRGSGGIENVFSLESPRALWRSDEKQPAPFWDYKVPEKQATWPALQDSLGSDISAVVSSQHSLSKHPLLNYRERKMLSTRVSLVGMGTSSLWSKSDLTPRLCAWSLFL